MGDSASAKKKDPAGRLGQVQLLAFNDYHGHVEPGGSGTADGVEAGGGEYLSAIMS